MPVMNFRAYRDGGAIVSGGTAGALIGTVTETEALVAGDVAALIAPPSTDGTQMNIGVRTFSNGAVLEFTLRDSAGGFKQKVNGVYNPGSFQQLPGSQLFSVALGASDSITVVVLSGSALVFGIRVDSSQDISYQLARMVSHTTNATGPPSNDRFGGCFIATAAFGTPLEKHVSILREFRDRCLLTTSAGKAFAKFYYEVSPPMAGIIAQNGGLRFITRCILMPFVGMAYLMVNYGALATLISTLFLILMMSALIWTIRRKIMVVNK
jgi:hypothetical protein